MDDARADRMEERLSHLQRLADDLSEVVARQAQEIATLERRVAMLMERESRREADAGEGIALADQKPPHW